MSILTNFRVTNPVPTDPLEDPLDTIVAADGGVLVSDSCTSTRALAVTAGLRIAARTGNPLTVIDCPALRQALATAITAAQPTASTPVPWQLVLPHELLARPGLVRRDCVLLTNRAVAAPGTSTARAVLAAVRTAAHAVVAMRERDLQTDPALAMAAGGAIVHLDRPATG